MFEGLKALSAIDIRSILSALSDAVVSLHSRMTGAYGSTATIAVYLTSGALVVLMLWRLLKLSFDIIRFVAIPAIVVALLGAWLLPVTFYHALPLAATLFSGILLLRG